MTSSVQALDSVSVVGAVPQPEHTQAPARLLTTTQALRQRLRSDAGMRRKLIQLVAVVTLFIAFMVLALIPTLASRIRRKATPEDRGQRETPGSKQDVPTPESRTHPSLGRRPSTPPPMDRQHLVSFVSRRPRIG